MTPSSHRIDRQVVYGFLFIGLIGLLIAGTIAQYRGAFEDNVVITVESDRAGLTLAKGAPIKLRGVEIGDVGEIDFDGETVMIELEIDHDKVHRVPADVTAQIVPPTAFGAKYVQLTTPPGSTAEPIEAGALIPATRVTVEVDEAFENLTEVLDVARPAEVNAALTAVAGAVDQRGLLVGELISQTDQYLVSLNPALPTLSSDLRVADDVLAVYGAARPDLIGTLTQTGEISDALVRQQVSLRAIERSLTTFSDEADVLLRSAEDGIVTTLTLLEPVTRTLERYSPELPCVVLGLVAVNGPMEAAIGGTNPGLTTHSRLIPRRDPYTYGQNLPLLGEDRGPVCFGLPHITPAEAALPPPSMRTGANPHVGRQPTPSQSALDTLLGLLAGGVILP
ncbi:MCE family protein [Nocardioides sp.]|nr:MCE family protein [Nocardioides sp.]THJ16024.1 MCE family protein [Nocardioides sp.]